MREEIYANDHLDPKHLRRNIETFIEAYTIAAVCIRRWLINRRRNSSSNSSSPHLTVAPR
jgi:hypothetical protein